MESQIEIMRGSITALKKKSEKKVKKTKPYSPPTASTSKASTKAAAKPAPKKKGGRKATSSALVDDDVLTFEQKKDLSEAISSLDGTKLEKVIQIIHEGVPEIRDVSIILYIIFVDVKLVFQSTEEIELEIDLLPSHVLTKLYNFVIRPSLRTAAPKRTRTGKGTGTGGLKRKSMDEDVEAEKIRQLEARMALFDTPDAASANERIVNGHDSDRSSDSSDQSDSSGSDSE
jgi:Bromodomain extra-terminal - transcription regulation